MDADTSVTATFSQYLTVTTPNGGESWTSGDTYYIQWTYAGDPGRFVTIELLKGGVLAATIANRTFAGSGGTGSYRWKTPSKQEVGSDCRIRVTSTSDSSHTEVSDAHFTIQ